MRTADLDYPLDPKHIATTGAQPRDAARLMVIDRATDRIAHAHVRDLPKLRLGLSDNPSARAMIGPNDLLVFNRTRVLPAYFEATRVDTGGKLSGLFLNDHAHHGERLWTVMLQAKGRLRTGEVVRLPDGTCLHLQDPSGPGQWCVRVDGDGDTTAILNRVGSPPLPPYIRKARLQQHLPQTNPTDADRYNTVYAQDAGSVAAPTAGLHFTDRLFDELKQTGVRTAMLTLHVGIGTFAPVRTDRVHDHPIHPEQIHIPRRTIAELAETRRRGGIIIPVGTTTVRALESLPDTSLKSPTEPPGGSDYTSETRLLIAPAIGPDGTAAPYPLRFTDALMTNFHLPRSTLLAMVAAMPGVGIERLIGWYHIAIEKGYRFYSYGDAMLIR